MGQSLGSSHSRIARQAVLAGLFLAGAFSQARAHLTAQWDAYLIEAKNYACDGKTERARLSLDQAMGQSGTYWVHIEHTRSWTYVLEGDLERAEEVLSKILRGIATQREDSPDLRRDQVLIGLVQRDRARVARDQGKPDLARSLFEQAFEHLETTRRELDLELRGKDFLTRQESENQLMVLYALSTTGVALETFYRKQGELEALGELTPRVDAIAAIKRPETVAQDDCELR